MQVVILLCLLTQEDRLRMYIDKHTSDLIVGNLSVCPN